MKKNIWYIGMAVVIGFLIGWLVFSTNNTDATQKMDASALSDTHDHAGANNQMWTCSMHPQIMQPEPGNCPICGMDLIPAASISGGLGVNEIRMTENAMALANIHTTIVGLGAGTGEDQIISLSGKIATNVEQNSVQSSYFDGRLEQLNVSYEGQEVKQGQLLATIYAPNLVAAQQELITAASIQESQPALYKAVRNKLKLWKLSDNQIDAIVSTGNVRENFPIYATVSGTVATVMAAEGDYVKQGQPILKVSNLNSVWAEFDAYENQISQFKKGQNIKITTSAYPSKEFNAVISFIDPVLKNSTRTVTIRTTLNNKESLFKPGMFVTGKIRGSVQANEASLDIPTTAVLWTGERSLVYVKTNPNEPIFEMREVILGLRKGDNYSVTSGLSIGEEIVTNGTFTVDAAAQLQGKKSMMNKSGTKTMTGHEGHIGMQGGTENKSKAASMMEMKLPQAFQTALQVALKPYFEMVNAFVASNPNQVAAFAKATAEKINAITIGDLEMREKSYLSKSVAVLDAISSTRNIVSQRDHLMNLNEYMVALAINIKTPSETLYVQKCPMANKNRGATWLSLEKEIKNPYYGEDMLTCGSIIEVIDDHKN